MKNRGIKAFVLLLFFVYMAALLYFLFFSERYGRTLQRDYTYNLVPFSEIKRFITNYKILGFEGFAVNMIGNVVAFIPFGMLLPVVIGNSRNSALIILDGFVVSVCIEFIQLFTKVGAFDVDDIILNTTGVIIGYIIYRCLRRAYKKRGRKKR